MKKLILITILNILLVLGILFAPKLIARKELKEYAQAQHWNDYKVISVEKLKNLKIYEVVYATGDGVNKITIVYSPSTNEIRGIK